MESLQGDAQKKRTLTLIGFNLIYIYIMK